MFFVGIINEIGGEAAISLKYLYYKYKLIVNTTYTCHGAAVTQFRLFLCLFIGSSLGLSGQGVIDIQGIDFSVPLSGNNGSRDGSTAEEAFVDDVFLESISILVDGELEEFVVADGEVVVGQSAFVRSGLQYVNAEFGDLDDGSDGNPNPFVQIGLVAEGDPITTLITENTEPAIQNAAVAAAVSSFSLVQGVDGEGPAYTFDVIFGSGVLDNDFGADSVPEFVLLERGFNSDYSLRAIIGGSAANPIYSASLEVLVSAQQGTGIFINTNEVTNAQELASFGVDASSFGIAAGEAIFGLSITSINDTGADVIAQFITAQSVDQLVPVPTSLPEPSALLLVVVGGVVLMRRHR